MNKNINLSHQNLIDEYCIRRKVRGLFQKKLDGYISKLERFNIEYQNFQKTGTISHEFTEELLKGYRDITSHMYRLSESELSNYPTYDDLERSLQSEGYDTEELYNNFLSNEPRVN